jgi:hypothetical protein
MDDLSRFCRLNPDRPDHGERGAGNRTVTGRYGPGKSRRMLRCRTRRARFSERKGTPLFGAELAPEKVESVLEHVAEGCGVCQTGRLCKVNRNAALGVSRVSRAIDTAFVERQDATDRHRDARKARKTYRFSKGWRFHEAVTYLTPYVYNFCWRVRTLTIRDGHGRRVRRTPAMAAGLTDHTWSMREWMSLPAVQQC